MEEKEPQKEKECGVVLVYQDASHLLSSISVCFSFSPLLLPSFFY